MTIGNINIEETIKNILTDVNRDKTLSPGPIQSINLLIIVINLLIQRMGLNSNNSSMPPSSELGSKRRKRQARIKKKRFDKLPGGQEGHEGSTLEQFDDPDETIELSIARRELPAGKKYIHREIETRQVIDVDLNFIVREYQAEVLIDSDGNSFVADFTSHIRPMN